MKTLQIATFGADGQDGIALGIRSFSVHKLALICFSSDKNRAEDFAKKIISVLGVPITITIVTKENVVRDTMESVNEILNLHANEFEQVLLNVSSGDKLIGCAALSAAFINGIQAFGMDDTHTVPLLMRRTVSPRSRHSITRTRSVSGRANFGRRDTVSTSNPAQSPL